MLNGMISQLAIDKFSLSMRNFFGPIVKFVYYLIAKSINLMNTLAGNRYELDTVIEDFLNSIFVLLIIFMIFRLTISMLTFLINPDSFSDKSAGFSKMIVRIVVSVVLLVSIQPIFNLLYNVQEQLLNGETGNVIDNIFFSNEDNIVFLADTADGQEAKYIYTITKMDPHCPDDYEMYAETRGDAFAMQALRPFYTINYPTEEELNEVNVLADKSAIATNMDSELEEDGGNGYCGIHKIDLGSNGEIKLDQDQATEFLTYPRTVSQLLSMKIYSNSVTDDTTAGTVGKIIVTALNPSVGATVTAIDKLTGAEEYVVDFSYIWALIFGIFIALLVISFCFDVVIRAFTLFLYQIIAPIPIISYMSPNKKDSDMLMNWVKKTLSCWASVFIRVALLDILIYLINIILNSSTMLSLGNNGLVAQIFIIAGALMFAKKLPKLLEEIIPGLKLDGGFKLNPFKRIKDEAIGGGLLAGAGAAALGMGVSGLTQAGSNAIAFGRERNLLRKQINEAKSKGDTAKATKLQHRLDHMNGARLAQTTAGGLFGGMRRGAVSGYKTGQSGSANVFKNLPKDLKGGNIARNTRTAIRTFNNDLVDAASDKIAAANAKYAAGGYGAVGSPAAITARDADIAAARKEATDQRYTWFDRNVVERVDRGTGVKNTYGGYGFYDEKIEKLTQEIENRHQQELTLRQSVTSKITNDTSVKMDARMFEELRNKMADSKLNFDQISSYYNAASATYINSDFEKIVKDINAKYGIAEADIRTDYDNYRVDLSAITGLDNDQKELKTERKGYQEMMEARKEAQGK